MLSPNFHIEISKAGLGVVSKSRAAVVRNKKVRCEFSHVFKRPTPFKKSFVRTKGLTSLLPSFGATLGGNHPLRDTLRWAGSKN